MHLASGGAPPVQGLLIDLDGVVYTGAEPIPGAPEFLARARERGLPFLLVTNNSTRGSEDVAARLAAMRITVQPREILTSGEAAAALVAAQTPGARVLVVGEQGLVDAVARAGLTPVTGGSAVDVVIAGLDRAFTYATLTAATTAILAGARFVATNADALLPVEGGSFLPGAGSIVASIRTATGVEPEVVGKPEAGLFHRGLEILGITDPRGAVMVGDRVDTDIDGARLAGLRTALVLTGVTGADQARALQPSPDFVTPGLTELAPLVGL